MIAHASKTVHVADGDLVAAIASGNLTSLGVLFDRYYDDVRRVLSRLGIAPSDLDDLVQQTFLDVPRASTRFRPGAAVRPWLFGLATVVARRRRRSLSRMFARLQEWARQPPAAAAPTPAEKYEQSAEAQRAWRALASLAPKKRDAFVLVALEGLPCAEAAEALGVPVATIWTRVHHARIELRALLEERES